MRSVRLDHELEGRLHEAARAANEPVSCFIRDAVRRRCEQVLGDRLDLRLADLLGSVSGGRRSRGSRRTGRAFKRLLRRGRRT